MRQEPFWANDPIAAPTRQQREPAPFWANDPAATPAPGAVPPQDGPDAPFQPELLPGDNGIYPPPPLAGATSPPPPIDTIGEEEARANRNVFGAQGTRLDPIDLNTLPAEDRAYLNAGMYVKLGNGEVRRMMADARPNAGGPGTQEIRPGLFVEENADVPTDMAKSLPTGVVEGVTGLYGAPGWLYNMLPQGARDFIAPEGTIGPRGILNVLPTGEQMNQGIRDQIGYDYYQPQTVPGEYARTLGEFLPGGVAPGGVGAKIASVAVPAFASETAGQIARGMSGGRRDTAGEGFARLAGGLGGGLGVGAVTGLRGGAEIALRGAAEGVTPQQLQMAAALRQDASGLGINMTNANALQQVTGGATGLGQLQRAVEGSSPLLQRYFAELPDQIRTATMAELDRIGPSIPPSTLAPRVQQASSGVLDTLRRRANEDAGPFYARLPGQSLPEADYAALAENPSFQRALGDVRGNAEIAPNLMAGGAAVPDNDLGVINAVVKRLRTLSDEAVPNSMRTGGDEETAAVRTNAANLADELARQASRDYAMGRDTVRSVNEQLIDPLRAGVIGALADTSETAPNLATMTERAFPPVPFEGQADETALAFELMGQIDPTVGGPLVRQHLARQFMASMKDKTGGPNQFGGADFAARMFGNEEQRRTVLRAIDETAPRPDPYMAFPEINPNVQQGRPSDDMARLVDVLLATGQRHRGGSQTAFIQQLQEDLRGGDLASNAVRGTLNIPGIPGQIARGFDDMVARNNQQTLADLLMANSDEFNARLTSAINRPRGANRVRAAATLGAVQED